MQEEDKSTAGAPLVRSSGHSLVVHSNSLVTRGIRDLEAAAQAAGNLLRPSAESTSERAERILVVDDEEAIRNTICAMLTASGYQCQAVAGGLDALALLESGEEFDVLVHDLLNAPLDGIGLLERAKKRFPEMPVIVATAIHDISVALACFQNGAYDYLLEPFEREQLLVAVRRALEYRRLKQKRGFTAWEEGLYRLILPVVDDQFSVPVLDGSRKHVRDLGKGDIVPVMREDRLHWFQLFEDNGKLRAIDFVPSEGE